MKKVKVYSRSALISCCKFISLTLFSYFCNLGRNLNSRIKASLAYNSISLQSSVVTIRPRVIAFFVRCARNGHMVDHVCLFAWLISRTAKRIIIKFGMDIMSLKDTLAETWTALAHHTRNALWRNLHKLSTDHELIAARNVSLAAMHGIASGSNVRYYPTWKHLPLKERNEQDCYNT
jgi:hypothetical protein